jgi:hypothetical protein
VLAPVIKPARIRPYPEPFQSAGKGRRCPRGRLRSARNSTSSCCPTETSGILSCRFQRASPPGSIRRVRRWSFPSCPAFRIGRRAAASLRSCQSCWTSLSPSSTFYRVNPICFSSHVSKAACVRRSGGMPSQRTAVVPGNRDDPIPRERPLSLVEPHFINPANAAPIGP